jgi:hypothetical protein
MVKSTQSKFDYETMWWLVCSAIAVILIFFISRRLAGGL